MNQTQVNNFLKCFLQIDDLPANLLVLHDDHAAYLKSNNSWIQHRHDELDDSSRHDLLVAKIIAMLMLFFASVTIGAIPFILNRCYHWTESQTNARSATVVKCLLYFGGGVLLATTFLHLLPEVQELVENLQDCARLPELTFPLPELLMCVGFFLMYFIEEAIHAYIQYAGAGAAAFERGHSVRNSYLMKGGIAAPSLTENDTNNSTLTSTSVPDAEKAKYEHKDQQQQHGYNHEHHQQQHCHHTHLPGDMKTDEMIKSSLRGLLIVLALSLHELFEGVAIGLERSSSTVFFMFGAVSAHKLVLAFCVGVELIVARTTLALSIVYIMTFAIVSPLGIGLGILISYNGDLSAPSLISAVLQGLACGTLLYVVFFEILSKNHSGLMAYLALFVGFIVMFGLQQLGAASGHGHSHGTCGSDESESQQYHDDYHHHSRQQPISTTGSNKLPYNSNSNYEQQLQVLRQVSQKLLENHKKNI